MNYHCFAFVIPCGVPENDGV